MIFYPIEVPDLIHILSYLRFSELSLSPLIHHSTYILLHSFAILKLFDIYTFYFPKLTLSYFFGQ